MAVLGAQERIDAALQGWSGITSRPHRFGGTEYNLGRREIGHVHGDSLVDIPFPKKVRNELVAAGRAEPHHILPESGWVSIFLKQASDVDRAIELLHLSFEIASEKDEEITQQCGALIFACSCLFTSSCLLRIS